MFLLQACGTACTVAKHALSCRLAHHGCHTSEGEHPRAFHDQAHPGASSGWGFAMAASGSRSGSSSSSFDITTAMASPELPT
eukprot:6198765-Pleurochrysis_carterae.AAC.3